MQEEASKLSWRVSRCSQSETQEWRKCKRSLALNLSKKSKHFFRNSEKLKHSIAKKKSNFSHASETTTFLLKKWKMWVKREKN